MNFRGHFLSAIAAIIIITVFALFHPQDTYLKYNLSTIELISILSIFIFYALIPDIDCDSNIQTIVYSGILFTEGFLIYTQRYKSAAILGALTTIPIIAKHRGLCHSWLFGIVISLPFALVNWIFIIPAFAGFALHKVCD